MGARIAPEVVAHRAFREAEYTPGQPVGATIVATPPAGAFVYAVVDAPPLGWEVARISDGGQFDGANGKVKWGPFFDDQPRVLHYEATPPGEASGGQSFRGLISVDGTDTPIADGRIQPLGDSDGDVNPGSPGPPALVGIMDGLRGANAVTGFADTFISPLGENCALSSFSLDATEPLTLDRVTPTYTGPGAVPSATWIDDGGGRHTVHLDPSPEPGHWLKLDMHVTSKRTGVSAPVTVWVAHQPLDINGDGRSDIHDATAFGAGFSAGDSAALIDINCDGVVNARDATAFGTHWNAGWANTELPPKP